MIIAFAQLVAVFARVYAQAPSGFPDVVPSAFNLEQAPPGPPTPIPGPVNSAAPLPAQPLTPPPKSPMVVDPELVFGPPPAEMVPRFVSPDSFHPMFRLHQTISDAVGDNGELTTLGGFFPHPCDYGLWFLDGQFDILEDAHNPGQQTLNFAASLGLGWRWLDPSDGVVYGLNGWYDVDRSHPGFVHQASVGAEVLGEVWDLRTNGYFPCGANRQPVSFTSLGPTFRGAEALPGVDMECGRRIGGWLGEYGVSTYAGWYYYRDDRTLNAFGGSMRIEARLSDALTLEARMTHDAVFKTNVAFGVTWLLPTAGKCKTCHPESPDYYRLVQPVERNRTIVFGPAGVP